MWQEAMKKVRERGKKQQRLRVYSRHEFTYAREALFTGGQSRCWAGNPYQFERLTRARLKVHSDDACACVCTYTRRTQARACARVVSYVVYECRERVSLALYIYTYVCVYAEQRIKSCKPVLHQRRLARILFNLIYLCYSCCE